MGADLLAGQGQTFVFRFTPSSAFNPVLAELVFTCEGGVEAPVVAGVNTLLLSASNSPVADVIALNAVNSFPPLPASTVGVAENGATFFAVAVVNVGAADSIEVAASLSDPGLSLSVSVCRESADCLAEAGPEFSAVLAAGQTDSFLLLVESSGQFPFQPESSRVVVEFRDSAGVVRGATSVAVATL